jgi:hypothetical protein
MSATPAAVAKYTSDGVQLTAENAAIKTSHVDAINAGDSEVEMFFVDPAHGQLLLDERFTILSRIGALHEGIEVDDSLGLGTTVPLTPSVPCVLVVDERREIETVARVRAFAYDGETDRYSVEVVE